MTSPKLIPNRPTPEGRALGVQLARMTDQAKARALAGEICGEIGWDSPKCREMGR